jgi:hypothetical protein
MQNSQAACKGPMLAYKAAKKAAAMGFACTIIPCSLQETIVRLNWIHAACMGILLKKRDLMQPAWPISIDKTASCRLQPVWIEEQRAVPCLFIQKEPGFISFVDELQRVSIVKPNKSKLLLFI